MSLKAFHVVFIAASILMGFGVGGWSLYQYYTDGSGANLGLGLCFTALGVALIIYSRRILQKLKHISYL